ncbi:tRNA-uridine aminocarboxypropyltransferase [Azospirillum doebereinerae]|uniref:tRNA-uridine aminocarboxypropyltransferase n=1 Tax=Azospirillum doebereinerae TaxID=92933 RepID=A0A433JFT0_9PROT|nr:tRNA-uridine aminocarboxypropyltransferase [Azospirillum doebereinerae]MCG5241049.1 DTW domain-containing protein [Azospirillum doebereinerae]RUQ76033.1 DTW domain-containing protein [Azospirillum doebereinerae]
MHSATPPESCPTCLKPNHLCICEAVEPVKNGVFLLILQHPQEKRENLGTAQIAHLQFANSALKVGLSWPNLKRILGREVDYKRWGVLYLGPVKADNPAAKAEIAVVDRNGVPQQDSRQVLADLEGVIVLDGTWSQAKTLWWRNAWLLKCRRVVLHPEFQSLYGQARKEPRRESVSTLEASAFLLSRLERDAGIMDRALKPFALLLKKIRTPRPRAAKPGAEAGGADVEMDAGENGAEG